MESRNGDTSNWRMTGKQEVIRDYCDLKDKWFLDVYNSIFNFKADARRTSALVTEWSQYFGHSDELSC